MVLTYLKSPSKAKELTYIQKNNVKLWHYLQLAYT